MYEMEKGFEQEPPASLHMAYTGVDRSGAELVPSNHLPDTVCNLSQFLIAGGIDRFCYFKRTIEFLDLFLNLLGFIGSKNLLHLENLRFDDIWFVSLGETINADEGIYIRAPTKKVVASQQERTTLPGKDIVAAEFVSLTKFLNRFDCKHYHNNLYKLMKVAMDSLHGMYDLRLGVYKGMDKCMKSLREHRDYYQRYFFNDSRTSVLLHLDSSAFVDSSLPGDLLIRGNLHFGRGKLYSMVQEDDQYLLMGGSSATVFKLKLETSEIFEVHQSRLGLTSE